MQAIGIWHVHNANTWNHSKEWKKLYIFNFETNRSICAKDYILVNFNMLPSACQPYPAGHICLGVTVVKQPRHSPLTDFGKWGSYIPERDCIRSIRSNLPVQYSLRTNDHQAGII